MDDVIHHREFGSPLSSRTGPRGYCGAAARSWSRFAGAGSTFASMAPIDRISKCLGNLARLEGFEPPTLGLEERLPERDPLLRQQDGRHFFRACCLAGGGVGPAMDLRGHNIGHNRARLYKRAPIIRRDLRRRPRLFAALYLGASSHDCYTVPTMSDHP